MPRRPADANRSVSRSAATADRRIGATSPIGVSSEAVPSCGIDERDSRLHVHGDPARERRVNEDARSVCAQAVVLAPGVRVVELVEALDPGGEVEDRVDVVHRGGDCGRVEQVELGATRRMKLVAVLEREWLQRSTEDAAAAGDEQPHRASYSTTSRIPGSVLAHAPRGRAETPGDPRRADRLAVVGSAASKLPVPSSRMRSSRRELRATVCPASTSSGTSRMPMTPVAPATNMRIPTAP